MPSSDTQRRGCGDYAITRRGLLGAAATFTAWAALPRTALAGPGDPRLILVVLRGGMDGLSAVAPVGDPDLARARGLHALGAEGMPAGLALDPMFSLSPQLPRFAALYGGGEAIVVHAVATPYRERSHFDAQDMLESGLLAPNAGDTGWLGRALSVLPNAGMMAPTRGFAAGASVPLVMRGPAPVVTWMPAGFPEASDDTRMRLLDLYRHTDPGLTAALESGIALTGLVGTEAEMAAASLGIADAESDRRIRQVAEVAATAGRLMAAHDGPRIGTIDIEGWDTHADSNPTRGRLGLSLSALDGALVALKTALGPAWRDTVALVVTEFGRTVAINGTGGTDHGTATIALLVGGAVAGGRVVADWPGLAPKALYQGRDLKPTTDLRAVAKGVLRDHLGFGAGQLAEVVFPGSADVAPLDGLIRAA